MPVDWKSSESYNRLLAALYAATDGQVKLNYKRIADFYGEGATYDAIEGRFRIIKKQAQKLKDEVEAGRAIAPPRGTKSADTTPRKPKTPKTQASQGGVLNGRVTKSAQVSPSKRRPDAQLKHEMMDSSASASASASTSGTDATTPSSSGYGPDSAIGLENDDVTSLFNQHGYGTQSFHQHTSFQTQHSFRDAHSFHNDGYFDDSFARQPPPQQPNFNLLADWDPNMGMHAGDAI